jgi:hypothetical protein
MQCPRYGCFGSLLQYYLNAKYANVPRSMSNREQNGILKAFPFTSHTAVLAGQLKPASTNSEILSSKKKFGIHIIENTSATKFVTCDPKTVKAVPHQI